MEGYQGIALFNELEDLLGHDPVFYEETGVSSPPGDISKHSITLSQDYCKPQATSIPEFMQQHDINKQGLGDIDSLLTEGNSLLDQLMVANGLDLEPFSVDLADIDELASHPMALPTHCHDDQQYYAGCSGMQIPESPVSTLPSEPSSPIDLSSLEDNGVLTKPVSVPNEDLDTLLKSLMHSDVDNTLADEDYYSFSQSPQSSISSECSSDFSDDYTLKATPSKAKPKKKSTPYSKLPSGRKERKKLQNKEAAIRYRAKKKSEVKVMVGEEAELEERNSQLKSEVFNLEREIMCMKELLSDVFNVNSFS